MKIQSETDNLYLESLYSFLNPIIPLLEDDMVSEVMINGEHNTYYEKSGTLYHTDIKFQDHVLWAVVRNLAQYVGKNLQSGISHLDARFPDGSRVQIVLPPCSRSGVCIAIRKFSHKLLSLEDLVSNETLSTKTAKWLEILICMRKNIIVAGGTSSGKTTLLNVLGGLISPEERLIILEDSAELQILHENMVSMETRPAVSKEGYGKTTIRDLLQISLRLRPDRIIVGEVRGAEALDMLQAMTTGHAGSMSTIHANEPLAALRRLETLATYGTSGEIPLSAIRSQVASTVEVIIQMNRFWDGSRHITSICEVLPLDLNGSYSIMELFRYNLFGRDDKGRFVGKLTPTGNKSKFLSQLIFSDIDLDSDFFEP